MKSLQDLIVAYGDARADWARRIDGGTNDVPATLADLAARLREIKSVLSEREASQLIGDVRDHY